MKFNFEWDEGNKHKSVTKHGISNMEAESVWSDRNKLIFPSYTKFSESRYLCIGLSRKGNLLSNVFCIRNEKIRIISSRKANKKEIRIYEAQ